MRCSPQSLLPGISKGPLNDAEAGGTGLTGIARLAASGEVLPSAEAAPGGDKVGLFAGIDKVRFKRVCKPGDTILLEAEIIAVHGPVGRAKVEDGRAMLYFVEQPVHEENVGIFAGGLGRPTIPLSAPPP